MRLVQQTEQPGVVELNYTFLPLFLGGHQSLMQEIEQELGKRFAGRLLTEEVLDEMHEAVLDYLAGKYPYLEGLRDYLDGVKFVTAALPKPPKNEEAST